jgi:exodeoxyribonuclease-5
MVGEYDNKNLLNFGVPVLALGDIGQLEPVRAVAYYTEKNVDFLMTEIMRQGAESNIIRASMFLRQGKRLPVREYHDCKIRSGLIPLEELLAHCDEDSQILVGYNDTRRAINDAVRKAKGFDSPFPQPGEKVVCRFNQHDFGMMNGEQGIVTGYREVPIADRDEKALIYVNFKSLTTGREQRALFNPACFTGDEDERKAASKGVGAWDYGWALTVHSAQGSEWGRVLLKEEPPHNASYEKWMYTGATRAQRHLTIYNQ